MTVKASFWRKKTNTYASELYDHKNKTTYLSDGTLRDVLQECQRDPRLRVSPVWETLWVYFPLLVGSGPGALFQKGAISVNFARSKADVFGGLRSAIIDCKFFSVSGLLEFRYTMNEHKCKLCPVLLMLSPIQSSLEATLLVQYPSVPTPTTNIHSQDPPYLNPSPCNPRPHPHVFNAPSPYQIPAS